jgi:hypothetical protein
MYFRIRLRYLCDDIWIAKHRARRRRPFVAATRAHRDARRRRRADRDGRERDDDDDDAVDRRADRARWRRRDAR